MCHESKVKVLAGKLKYWRGRRGWVDAKVCMCIVPKKLQESSATGDKRTGKWLRKYHWKQFLSICGVCGNERPPKCWV